ncbi:thioredoxin family protein [Allopontixanthobacter sp.]|uniref:thioredoxin family protein n=1 Tax=Allopontixanthobacter sp. TaxID=2906452 RepID=UPI002AB9B939|nr:thioredoxin family protein [Allopontixanthobacter sp.]MDZ4306757.1 thioredoxin family protein [Allopontixanthobacter sp.]
MIRLTWALLIAIALWPAQARAAEAADFSEAAFAQAQQGNGLVVVETYAPWCLPCKLQAPLFEKAMKQPEFRSMNVFRVVEKTPPAVWKRLRITGFGTVVVFRNGREVARGTPTTEKDLFALLRRKS